MKNYSLAFAFSLVLVISGCQMGTEYILARHSIALQSTEILITATETKGTDVVETSTEQVPEVPVEIISTPVDFTQNFQVTAISGSYQFTEGPAAAPDGSVYFSDITSGRIYNWNDTGSVSVFKEGLNAPNGLAFDSEGNLIVCEGGAGRIISIEPHGGVSVLVDQFQGVRFNEPNDLWISPDGGIYFTDPSFQSDVVQGGEHVYYLSPDHSTITRVISGLVKPNGIVGTVEGSTLFVSDYGAGKIYSFEIEKDGSLSNQQLFITVGSDGMALDDAGNLFITTLNEVQVYDHKAVLLKEIHLQENPTNVTFAGTGENILFITARTVVYSITLSPGDVVATPSDSMKLTSPDLPSDGRLPVKYTCDGSASTLALNWSDAPEGTQSYAVIMHHTASAEDIHWYLVLYNIPPDVTGLPENFTGTGVLGNNSVNGRTEYAPPCSKGPGDKTYTYTVYALSAQPKIILPESEVSRAVLLDAMKDITLASAELDVIYARP